MHRSFSSETKSKEPKSLRGASGWEGLEVTCTTVLTSHERGHQSCRPLRSQQLLCPELFLHPCPREPQLGSCLEAPKLELRKAACICAPMPTPLIYSPPRDRPVPCWVRGPHPWVPQQTPTWFETHKAGMRMASATAN